MAAPTECSRASLLGTVPRVVLVVLAVDFALALVHLVSFTIDHSLNGLNALVNLDGEGNLPTWYSSIKLFAIAVCLGLLAWIERTSRGSLLFAALTLVFLSLSADETIQAHELVGEKLDALLPGGDRKNTVFAATGIWMFVLGLPAIAAITLLFWYARSFLRMAPAAFTKCLAGLAVFTAGALGVETLSNFAVPGSAARLAQVTIEELLEMLGATILLWGCGDLLQAWNVRLEVRPAPGAGARGEEQR
jgi:hypothetical protein